MRTLIWFLLFREEGKEENYPGAAGAMDPPVHREYSLWTWHKESVMVSKGRSKWYYCEGRKTWQGYTGGGGGRNFHLGIE